MENLKVSIILPVFQVSAYIERCVKSVMMQTYGNIECVIVDDFTPDDSILKCEKCIDDYQGNIQFVILHHEQNLGLSAARNTGMKAATGDYVFFLDSDDELTAESIENLVRPVLNDPSIEMVLGNVKYCSDGVLLPKSLKRRKMRHEQYITTRDAVRDLFFKKSDCFSEAWNRLIRRDFLEENNIYFHEGLVLESSLWNFFLVKHLAHLFFIKEVTYIYYRRPFSISTGLCRNERVGMKEKIITILANNFTEGEKGREARFYLVKFCFCIIQKPKSQAFTQSARLFRKALAEDHFWVEELLLVFVMSLSKITLGRTFYSFVMKVLRPMHRCVGR